MLIGELKKAFGTNVLVPPLKVPCIIVPPGYGLPDTATSAIALQQKDDCTSAVVWNFASVV